MSTSDQPNTPPLTRKQLRELRNTGATPVVPATSEMPAADPAAEADRTDTGRQGPAAGGSPAAAPAPTLTAARPSSPFAPPAEGAARPAPLPRAAKPAPVHTAPVPDASVDLGAAPLTRRQARQQERIRTASVPVITPDVVSSGTVPVAPPAEAVPTAAQQAAQSVTETQNPFAPSAGPYAPSAPAAPAAQPAAAPAAASATATVIDPSPWTQHAAEDEPDSDTGWLRAVVGENEPTEVPASAAPVEPAAAPAERAVLNPMFGAGLLANARAASDTSASFEQLLTRDTSSTGSVAAPHALILSHAAGAPLVAPIAGTGELLVTGTLVLPEGLGSTGHAPGVADGREVDAVLVDGELPAHSSPTPIAASAAVSTIKTADEIIQPPAPERGGKLMVSLAITAGVLALALVGVLVYALATGVIS